MGKIKFTSKIVGIFETRSKIEPRAFIESFKRKNIPLYDIKITKKSISFCSPLSNREKIFAISDNMCYNVTEKGYKGKYAIFAKTFGYVFLSAAFLVSGIFAKLSDGYIGRVVYVGDGEELKSSIELVLQSEKIGVGAKFPSDLNALSNKIASSDSLFSFASVKKSGRALVIEAAASVGQSIPLNEWKNQIICKHGGVVRRITVYGGTAVVSVGQTVKAGDLLIGGFYEKNGERFQTEASGDVEIIVTESYEIKTFGEGKTFEDKAKAVARDKAGNKDVVSITATLAGEKTYRVDVFYAVIDK